jgi:hypothetical protein
VFHSNGCTGHTNLENHFLFVLVKRMEEMMKKKPERLLHP